MTTSRPITPTQVADALVPRFLSGETMLCSEVAKAYVVSRDSAGVAVRIARDVLRDEYNVILPIANYEGDYLLGITTSAVDAFYGEVPQLRALRTRQRNLVCRLNATMALVKSRPRMGAVVLKSIESGLQHMDDVLDTALEFMADEIESVKPKQTEATR